MVDTPFGINLNGFGVVLTELEQIKKAAISETVWVVGTNVKYGAYLEFGTSSMPAYPWLRPAVNEFNRNPEGFLVKHTDTFVDQIDDAEELVAKITLSLERQMKLNVSANAANRRSPGTHPEHPKIQSNTLRASIEAEKV